MSGERPEGSVVEPVVARPGEWRRAMLLNEQLMVTLFCEHGNARHLGCERCARRAFMVIGV